jgi:hypothetical protein
MAPRIKLPVSRDFTLADKRNQRLERVTLAIVVAVAIIAAAISFVALKWVGEYINMGAIAFLLPLAIDGFGIICAFGIVRSQSMGEPLRKRLSEWVGLGYALGLSVAGNIVHALSAITGAKPPIWLVIGFVSAIPVIVAYGIHLLGRAIDGGVSAHVLASDPDKVQFGLAQIGDENRTAASAPAPRKATPAPAPASQGPRVEPAMAAAVADANSRNTPAPWGPRSVDGNPLKAAARAEFDRMLVEAPGVKPDAAEIHRIIESPKDKATTRRWVSDWFEEYLTSTGATRPELDLPKADESKADAATG